MFYLTFQTHLNVLILRNKQLERKLTQNVFQFISWVFVLIFFINWNFSLGPFNVFIAKIGLSYSQIHVWHVYVLQRPCKFLSGIDIVLFILEFCKLTDLYIFSCYLISHRNVLEKVQPSIHISIVYTFLETSILILWPRKRYFLRD